MKKRAIGFLISAVLVLAVTGTAFSMWQFDALFHSPEHTATIRQDDIEENYSFSQTSSKKYTQKEYTIYLFPSALYLNDYVDYLNGVTTNKPENLYGYIEAELDEQGNIVYRELVDNNGNVYRNDIVSYQAEYKDVTRTTPAGENYGTIYEDPEITCGGDGAYIGNIFKNAGGEYSELYLNAPAESDAHYASIFDKSYSGKWTGTLSYLDGAGKQIKITIPTEEEIKNGKVLTEAEKQQILYMHEIGNPELDDKIAANVGQYGQRKYLWRNQHRYDRFGAWRTLSYGAGRYLPLKIKVSGDFTYKNFADRVLSPICSMPDGSSSNSCDLTFTQWSYVSGSKESYQLPFYANDGNTKADEYTQRQKRVQNAFLNYRLDKYFDIMQDFENFSDNENVIRLFPTFSSGKNSVQADNYVSTGTGTGTGTGSEIDPAKLWEQGIDRGTGDTIFINTDDSKGNSATGGNWTDDRYIRDNRLYSTLTSERIATYVDQTDTTGSTTDTVATTTVQGIRCSMYSNLDFGTLEEQQNVANKQFNLEIWMQPKSGPQAESSRENLLIYSVPNAVIQNMLSKYGDGLYNLYLFVGNSGLSGNGEKASIANLLEHIGNSDAFPSLSGKNLISLEDLGKSRANDFGNAEYSDMCISKGDTAINAKDIVWPASGRIDNLWSCYLGPKGFGETGKYYRPVMLCVEKVRDTRIITNLKVDENAAVGDGKNQVNDLWSAYDTTTSAFRYVSEDIYSVARGEAKVDMTAEPLNAKYPYSYYISGVDFTNAAADYFQIRFQRKYRDDLPFMGTDGVAGVDDPKGTGTTGNNLGPNIDVIYNPGAQGTFDETQRFVSAFGENGYFDAVTANMTGYEADTASTQVFFKLKTQEMRGVYDFLIIYVPSTFYTVRTTSADGTQHFTIYYDTKQADAALNAAGTNGKKYDHNKGFYVFAYRQTNIFLKITEHDMTATKEVTDGEGTAICVEHNNYEGNMLLFQSVYPIGAKITVDDPNQVVGHGSSTLNLGDYSVSKMGQKIALCVNNYVKALLANAGTRRTLEEVVLRDHVTGGVVAYYKTVAVGNEQAAIASGNYIEYNGRVWQLVFEDFVIRKNYIFYIDYLH